MVNKGRKVPELYSIQEYYCVVVTATPPLGERYPSSTESWPMIIKFLKFCLMRIHWASLLCAVWMDTAADNFSSGHSSIIFYPRQHIRHQSRQLHLLPEARKKSLSPTPPPPHQTTSPLDFWSLWDTAVLYLVSSQIQVHKTNKQKTTNSLVDNAFRHTYSGEIEVSVRISLFWFFFSLPHLIF